jgi:hypothetical protein
LRHTAIENYSRVAKSYIAFFFLRRFLVFFAFFAFFAFLRRFAMICLLADVGLRASEPDLAFDPFERFETGFLTGRGFEVSFGSIPKMPIMGLVESLLGIRFRIKQPAATYRARLSHLPIGMADIAGAHALKYELLRSETSRRKEFSIDNENSQRCCK